MGIYFFLLTTEISSDILKMQEDKKQITPEEESKMMTLKIRGRIYEVKQTEKSITLIGARGVEYGMRANYYNPQLFFVARHGSKIGGGVLKGVWIERMLDNNLKVVRD